MVPWTCMCRAQNMHRKSGQQVRTGCTTPLCSLKYPSPTQRQFIIRWSHNLPVSQNCLRPKSKLSPSSCLLYMEKVREKLRISMVWNHSIGRCRLVSTCEPSTSLLRNFLSAVRHKGRWVPEANQEFRVWISLHRKQDAQMCTCKNLTSLEVHPSTAQHSIWLSSS